jgi:hypothetical protein
VDLGKIMKGIRILGNLHLLSIHRSIQSYITSIEQACSSINTSDERCSKCGLQAAYGPSTLECDEKVPNVANNYFICIHAKKKMVFQLYVLFLTMHHTSLIKM